MKRVFGARGALPGRALSRRWGSTGHRTSVTDQLWAMRKNPTPGELDGELPRSILSKTPMYSDVEVTYDFEHDRGLVVDYENPFGNVRLGKIFEDVDACACTSANLHADDDNPTTRPLSIVTASVDRIDFTRQIEMNTQLKMQSRVVHTGRTSLQVLVNISQMDHGSWELLMQAWFTMVALDKKTGKGAPINKIVPSAGDPQDEELFNLAHQRKVERVEVKKQSLSQTAPTEEETTLIHTLFSRQSKKGECAVAECGRPAIWISDTKLSSTNHCMPEDRNTNNKIFGGSLMRWGFELGYSCASLVNSDARPTLYTSDSISFIRPVFIGDILSLQSEMVYSDPTEKLAVVNVRCEARRSLVQPIADKGTSSADRRKETNSFCFIFKYRDQDEVPVVVPHTYNEAIRYLEGRRALHRCVEAHRRLADTHTQNITTQ